VQLVDLVDPDTNAGRALSSAYSPIERVLQRTDDGIVYNKVL
jgi:hypothetical protein